jgi:hypothetical protein
MRTTAYSEELGMAGACSACIYLNTSHAASLPTSALHTASSPAGS